MYEFADKRVLVVGGSRGIGASIVQYFASKGAVVHFTFVSSEQEAVDLSAVTGAVGVRCDASDRLALAQTVASLGALDILVVSAGVLVAGNILELDPVAVDLMIDVNVRAPYFAAVEAARQMHDGGRIILIGSANAERMPFAGAAAYALSKSALPGLARALARELGPRAITVNVVQPGPVDTDMNPANSISADAQRGYMALPRFAVPGEIAAMVGYLASSEAAHVTGTRLTIDGGYSA